MTTIEASYEKFAHYLETGIEPIERSGIKVLECHRNHIKLLLPLQGNINHLGIILGGSLMLLAEMSGGAIFGVSFDFIKYIPIVKEVTMKFKRPALSDVTLEITLTNEEVDEIQKVLDENGKADFTIDLDIKDANDKTVALGQGIYQVRDLPEGMESPMAKLMD